jgi:hypothetical protein
MLPLSLCRLWQPDRAANAAQDSRSYTTPRGTIQTIAKVSYEELLLPNRERPEQKEDWFVRHG